MNTSDFEKDRATVTENARRLGAEMSARLDVGRYSMDEIAHFLVYGCDGEDSFLDEYRSLRQSIGELPAELSAQLHSSIYSYFEKKGVRACLSKFFNGESVSSQEIVYVKSPVSDEAYRLFCTVLENATVSYTQSFALACEEVYYGRAPYCILPYENSEEGTLSGFARLMKKYELCPHYVCSCRTENGTAGMVLLGRAPCTDVKNGLEMRLRLSFYNLNGELISKVIAVAGELGLSLFKTESLPLQWDEGRYGSSVTFCATMENIIPFLIYLALDVPACSDKAIYYRIDG